MIKYDLHVHLFTAWNKGRFSLEKDSRDIDNILGSIESSEINGISLVNFNDRRYEGFTDSARNRKTGKYTFKNEISNAIIFENQDNGKLLKIIKGQEVNTDKGHVLFLGQDYGVNIYPKIKLENSLEQGKQNNLVIIADHWWSNNGISKNNLIKYQNYFHGFEEFNGNYEKLKTKRIQGIKQKTGLNSIVSSDSHMLEDIGNAYIEFYEDIDFSSSEDLKNSLKERIKSGKFENHIKKRNPISSKVKHIALVLYDGKIRRRLGWLK
jgi:predicted metal-dependent phosphoesterase TrpH